MARNPIIREPYPELPTDHEETPPRHHSRHAEGLGVHHLVRLGGVSRRIVQARGQAGRRKVRRRHR